jgi:hypothetical protein
MTSEFLNLRSLSHSTLFSTMTLQPPFVMLPSFSVASFIYPSNHHSLLRPIFRFGVRICSTFRVDGHCSGVSGYLRRKRGSTVPTDLELTKFSSH